mgnify:CR=1 FL=1
MRHPCAYPPRAGQYFERPPAYRKSYANLGVSQRPVVAERLQGARTDAQLLADILVVHPTAEPFPFPLADNFIHPVGQEVELADHFLILFFRDNYYIHCIYSFLR